MNSFFFWINHKIKDLKQPIFLIEEKQGQRIILAVYKLGTSGSFSHPHPPFPPLSKLIFILHF